MRCSQPPRQGTISTKSRHLKANDSLALQSGQIADPPAQARVTAPRFAQPVAQSNTPELASTGASSFCSTCLKNQQFYTEALANYLPAPEDPHYAQYEASLDDYKRGLEERYPQVCVVCETRAIDRIQKAGYAAKTDHLRRLMSQSRDYGTATTSGWRVYILRAGQLTYYSSILGQLSWSILNSMLVDDDVVLLEMLNTQDLSPFNACLRRIRQERSLGLECSNITATIGGVALILGLLSMWWNPKWQHKLERRRGRLRGLKDFYQLQAGALLLRFLAWVWLKDPKASGLPLPTVRAFHQILIAVNIGLIIASRLIVKVDLSPMFAWNESIGPLVPESVRSQQLREINPNPEKAPPAAFPISKLAPPPRTPQEPHRIPTPPPEESPDAMEWEPSHNFQPRIQNQTPKSKTSYRSPFHGRLPPAPNNRFLNPHPKALDVPEKDSIGIPQGFFDPPVVPSSKADASEELSGPFVEPSFFPPSDYKADTGLEGMFGKVFSLQDQSIEAWDRSPARDPTKHNNNPDAVMLDIYDSSTGVTLGYAFIDYLHLIFAILLALSFCLLVCVSAFSSFSRAIDLPKLRLGITALAGIAAILALQSRTSTTKDVLLYLVELVIAITSGLYGISYSCSPTEKYHMLHSGFISAMAWQEFFLGMSGKGSGQMNSPAQQNADVGTSQPDQSTTPNHQVSAQSSSQPQAASFFESQPSRPTRQNQSNINSISSFTYKAPYQHISSFRPRSDSATSLNSSPDSEASTAVTNTTGFTTPRFRPSTRNDKGWSPGAGLGALDINEGPPSGRLRSRNKRF